MPLTVGIERWPLATPFAIARGVKTEAATVVARIAEDRADAQAPPPGPEVGIGECTPYARYGETLEATVAEIDAQSAWICDPLFSPAERRKRLQEALPAGAARNALDCALWDLEAKQTGRRVAEIAGLSPPNSVETAVTLGLDAPEAMAEAAARAVAAGRGGLLKAKLGEGDVARETQRLTAIRAAAPEARLIVDANEGWDLARLTALDPVCREIGALFIEQPLPADQDDALKGLDLKTPLCADESCHGPEDLARLQGLFGVVNIKLDKTGGLTEALALRAAAQAAGFEIMIGCMVAGSLAMAPAYLLTEGALAVDLDGPLLLAADREPAIRYEGARMFAPDPALWG